MLESEGTLKKCAKCNVEFVCKSEGGCWCNNYILSDLQLKELKKKYANCLCEDCIALLSKA